MESFDLQRYLARIERRNVSRVTENALRALHAGHLSAIPFENLDVRLGRRISLDLGDLQDKMVRRRRGGYCFEQNTLFLAALAAVGFRVEGLEARVRPPGATAPLPRTHMVLSVEAEERAWLADVGFGGDGPLFPIPMDGETSHQSLARFEVAREESGVRVLRTDLGGPWRELYSFTLEPAYPVDFEMANHYTSTHPESPFVNRLTVQSTTAGRRLALRGRILTEYRPDGEETRELSDEEVVRLLRDELTLEIGREEVLRALVSPPTEPGDPRGVSPS
ncbi:MAG: arylamine N-acetyltransferase [Thermoanaerobaculia bacterium]|nr:arylamine N-acetyltransferase [Thermoanaerobaculia bacterium]